MRNLIVLTGLVLLSAYAWGQVNDESSSVKKMELMQRHIEALEEQNRLLKSQAKSIALMENATKPGNSEEPLKDVTDARSKAHFYSEFYVPGRANLRDVKQSILDAGLRNNWEVINSSDNLVVLHLKHKDHDSTLYLEFDIEKITLYSNSYQKLKKSGWWKVQDPDGWIFTLQELIGESFE
jgi:hypothetical protein